MVLQAVLLKELIIFDSRVISCRVESYSLSLCASASLRGRSDLGDL